MALLKIVTDKLASYSAAKRANAKCEYSTVQYENNGCELSHQPTRLQEWHIRRVKPHGQAEEFLTCRGVVNNLFLSSRHLMQVKYYLLFRDPPFIKRKLQLCPKFRLRHV